MPGVRDAVPPRTPAVFTRHREALQRRGDPVQLASRPRICGPWIASLRTQ